MRQKRPQWAILWFSICLAFFNASFHATYPKRDLYKSKEIYTRASNQICMSIGHFFFNASFFATYLGRGCIYMCPKRLVYVRRKRPTCMRQKRPTKETYIYASKETYIYASEETPICIHQKLELAAKRDLHWQNANCMRQKRPFWA